MAGTTLNTRSVLQHTVGNVTGTTVPMVPAASVPAGQRVGIYALLLTVGAATNVTIQDTSGNPLSQAFQLAANGSIALDLMSGGDPWFQAQPGRGVQLSLSASALVGFDVYWAANI